MTGRTIIIIVAGIVIIAGLILYRIEGLSTSILANFTNYYNRQTAQNIAQTGASMALRQLAQNRTWRAGFPLMSMLGGKAYVTVTDSTFNGKSVIKVFSRGLAQKNTHPVSYDTATCTVLLAKSTVPPAIKGVITTGSHTGMHAGVCADGENHDNVSPYFLIPFSGTYALYTTSGIDSAGTSPAGGTAGGMDYFPMTPWNVAIYKQYQTWPGPGTYPLTPDSVLGGAAAGYPEGTLKALAQSGYKGSQYVTNPGALTYPLRGVTYVDLPSGSAFENASIFGSGILIVHNAQKNAVVRNCTNFYTGLVIADNVDRYGDFLCGAIITLNTGPAAVNVMGHGPGGMIFSKKAIERAIDITLGAGNGSASNVIAWRE